MTDPRDYMESVLARWQPEPLSEQLQNRIHTSLQQRQPRWRTLAWVSGVAAAAVWLIYLLVPPMWSRVAVETNAAVQMIPASSDEPTILNYTQAYAKSNEALDALMMRHARQQQLNSKPSDLLHITTRTLAE